MSSEFHQASKKELIPILFKRTINFGGGQAPKLILQGHHYPDNQNQRQYKKKKLQVNIPDEHMQKSSTKYYHTIQLYIKKTTHHYQLEFIHRMHDWFNIPKLINDTPHNKMKDENHIIKSINAGKAFDKIQHSFMITLKWVSREHTST